MPEPHDLDIDDRGHSNQQPGYLRRQTQFFMFKILSQVHAYMNFIVISPALRYGYNSPYYPVSREGSNGCITDSVR
jgi:hypothetical protein